MMATIFGNVATHFKILEQNLHYVCVALLYIVGLAKSVAKSSSN